MTCRIANGISFGFDDPPAEPARGNIVDHSFANQIACQLHAVHRKLRPAKTAEPPNRLMRPIGVVWFRSASHPGRVLTVRNAGALSDLDNITVRIAHVAECLAGLVPRLRDELGSSTFP